MIPTIKIDLAAVIKEIRESTDFLIRLPQLLLTSVLDTNIAFRERRERIVLLKEIVELREISKILQGVYFFKGDIIAYAKTVIAEKNIEGAGFIKDSFFYIADSLEQVRGTLAQTSFSNSELATEANMFIAKAIHAYNLFLSIENEDLIKSEVLSEVCSCVLELSDTASKFIQELDKHRNILDHTYN